MEEKELDQQFKKFLLIFPTELILPIRDQVFNGLSEDQANFLVKDILHNHPKIAMAFLYAYTPVDKMDLRFDLLKVMFPRSGKGPKQWRKEKTFIIKQCSNGFEHGGDIFNEEYEDLKYEIINISKSLSNKHNIIKKKLDALPGQLDIVMYSDLIKINADRLESPDWLKEFKGKTIEEIRNIYKNRRTGQRLDFLNIPNLPKGTLVEYPNGSIKLFMDFPETVNLREVSREIEKWEWQLVEWLTKVGQAIGPDTFSKSFNIERIDEKEVEKYPDQVIFRYRDKVIKILPFNLLLKEYPVFHKYLNPQLSIEVEKEEIEEDDKRAEIFAAIQEAAIKFKPGKFEKIQGYYEQAAKFKGKSLYTKYADKFSNEVMGHIDTLEFHDLWNSKRDEIRRTLKRKEFIELERCIKGVIDQEYFDPELVRLAQGTPLGKYTEQLMIEPVSIDQPYPDSEGDSKIIQIADDSSTKFVEEFEIRKSLEDVLNKARTFKERRIAQEIRKILAKKKEVNIAQLAKKLSMTPQGLSQLLKRWPKR